LKKVYGHARVITWFDKKGENIVIDTDNRNEPCAQEVIDDSETREEKR